MTVLATLAAAAFGCVVYGIAEARLHRTRSYTVPVLPPGSRSITMLQVSDTHLRLRSRRLVRFLESLSSRSYDVVLATGDLLGDPSSMQRCAALLNNLRAESIRAFVFGSSDYYAPKFKNYLDYFLKRRSHGTRKNPTDQFRALLVGAGWVDLNNKASVIRVNDVTIRFAGMDDPYLNRHEPSVVRRDPSDELAICVVHDPAPFEEVLASGFDLQVSGHTHGGQVRLPLIGAVVTNSTLPRKLASGLHRVRGGYLFVSPGLGTGKYAPFRFLSRPEASVLTLVPRS